MYSVQQLELRSAAAQPLWVDRACVLRVLTGCVWLTFEPSSADIWLLPGQTWCAPARVRLWLSAEHAPRSEGPPAAPVAALHMWLPLAPDVRAGIGMHAGAGWPSLRRALLSALPAGAAAAR